MRTIAINSNNLKKLTIAVIAGGAFASSYIAYQELKNPVSEPAVLRAAAAIHALNIGRIPAYGLTPGEKMFGDVTGNHTRIGKSITGELACDVYITKGVLHTGYDVALKKETGWDDFAYAAYVLGHEFQHCATMQNIDIANGHARTPETTVRRAQFARAVGINESMVQKLLSENHYQLKDLTSELASEQATKLQESISDVAGLLLVQKLAPDGLTIDAIDGLKRARNRYAQVDAEHDTTNALEWLSIQVSLDPKFGRHFTLEQIMHESYKIVAQSNAHVAHPEYGPLAAVIAH
jgi:hypothetical protein